MIAFLACVERGPLETQTVLLCRSIRHFAGRYRSTPIHTYQPRQGTEISADTLAALLELGVTHHTNILNAEFDDYGVGNKVFVCAHAERTLAEEVLVFLDSDTLVVGQPAELELPHGLDAAVRPASCHKYNSSGPEDPRDAYWRSVYRHLGIDRDCYVIHELGQRVRAYFSSGLIAVRRVAGLFARWEADFRTLVRAGLLPETGEMARMDEISLACTLTRVFERVQVLDGRYNYLIYFRPRLEPSWRHATLEELVHIHYRYWFNRPNFLEDVRPPIDCTGPVGRWLEGHLPLEPLRWETPTFPFEEPALA